MVEFTENTKKVEDELKEKLNQGEKGLREGIDELRKKAEETIEKAKEKLTPETITQIKEILKKIKKVVSNLPTEKVPGLDKVLEKLDLILEELDPPDKPGAAEEEIRAIIGLIDDQLIPYVAANVRAAKRDLDLYTRNLRLIFDYLLVMDRKLDDV